MFNFNISDIKAVVFDWDNTLAQSSPPLVYAVNEVLKDFHLPCWEIVKAKRDRDLSFRDNFPRIFGQNADQAYRTYKNIYLKIAPQMISRTPFAAEVLNYFKKRGIPILLMTNKDRELLEFELPILFDPEYFDCIVCGHEAMQDKPHGDHLFYTLNKCPLSQNICMKDVLVVGDSPQDSACALACGAKAVRIGKSSFDELNLQNEDIIYFDSFVDFYESLLLSS